MKVPIGFPVCRDCNTSSTYSFHENCPQGGALPLKIDTNTKIVYCESCHETWLIDNTTYHCTNCNTVVNANDICREVDQLVELAQLLARQIEYEQETQRKINRLSDLSIDVWIQSAIQAVATVSGFLIGKIVAIFKSIFFA